MRSIANRPSLEQAPVGALDRSFFVRHYTDPSLISTLRWANAVASNDSCHSTNGGTLGDRL
jgi:hypothetical protein